MQWVPQRGSTAAAKCMARMSDNIYAIEELDLSQEDTPSVPEIHRTMRHFEHKK